MINLSGDKDRVLREAFPVLKPGGRFAVSDVVMRGDVPAEIRRNMELWVGCIAGAMEESEYTSKLADAGFDQIDIEPTRVYDIEDARLPLRPRFRCGRAGSSGPGQIYERVHSRHKAGRILLLV